ncbi:MAG: iron-containing alcohol dehydrogenase, partial [Mesorhizobium sp.]
MTLFAAARLPREILFGNGQRAFICTDERLAGTPEFIEMLDGLKAAGIDTLVHDRTLPDVPRDSVGACIAEAKDFRP